MSHFEAITSHELTAFSEAMQGSAKAIKHTEIKDQISCFIKKPRSYSEEMQRRRQAAGSMHWPLARRSEHPLKTSLKILQIHQ